jgi:4-hydroxy-tetrahydrodipicolinate synthase
VYLLEELISGAAGVMTGFAYPEILVEVVRRFKSGDLEGASDIFYSHVALMRFEFQENIGMAIRKEVLRRRGAIADAGIRLPGGELDKHTRSSLDRLLAWIQESSDLNLQGKTSVGISQGD